MTRLLWRTVKIGPFMAGTIKRDKKQVKRWTNKATARLGNALYEGRVVFAGDYGLFYGQFYEYVTEEVTV